jgi:DNA repair protein RadC
VNDREITRRLADAGEVMGIQLMDHIILGEGGYFSFWEEARR